MKRRSATCSRLRPRSSTGSRRFASANAVPMRSSGPRPPTADWSSKTRVQNAPVDMDLAVLLGKPPKMLRDVKHRVATPAAFDESNIDLHEAALRILQLPAVPTRRS